MPKRVNFISIQHSSGIAAVGYQHQPIRTGYDQVIPQRVTDLYAFAARKAGVVKEISSTHLLVEYEDGELVGVELGRRFGTAEGSVFPHLVVSDAVVGQSFKRGHVLAWNDGWFVRDFFDETQVLWKNACLMNVALMDVPETYEDSHAISKKASAKMLSYATKIKTIHLKFSQKVTQLVREGEDVDAEQILCMIEDALTADNGLFTDDNLDALKMLSAQTPRSGVTGKVEKIEVLYRGDKEDMSESLQQISGLYDRKRALQVRRLRNEGATTGRVLDSVRVDGTILEQDSVAIRIFITYPVEFGVADKSVFGLQLKTVNGQVFEGENMTEDGEEIDAKFSNMSVFNRIVDSAYRIGCGTRVLLAGSKLTAKIYRGEV